VNALNRQPHLPALVRTLRENQRLLALLARWCEVDRLTPSTHAETFRKPADVAAYLAPEMADIQQEQLRVILLDRRNRLIQAPLVYQGGQTEMAIRLADCFREAVRHNAATLVLVHNHPSGDPSPSVDDLQVTREAGQAGLLLGITVSDHVILARDGFVSLRADGLYTPPEQTETQSPFETPPAPSWAYDCTHCGARARSMGARTLTCERCQAPVTSRPDLSAPILRPVAA
jgi:DNA repair protein RadC